MIEGFVQEYCDAKVKISSTDEALVEEEKDPKALEIRGTKILVFAMTATVRYHKQQHRVCLCLGHLALHWYYCRYACV